MLCGVVATAATFWLRGMGGRVVWQPVCPCVVCRYCDVLPCSTWARLTPHTLFHSSPPSPHTTPPQGFASIIKGIDMERVSEGMSAAQQAGIDPAALVQRFQQSPTLAEAIKSPRVMAALMDMAR